MSVQGKAPVYYLPLEQTVYQKCLIDIIIQLHKPHIYAYLEKLTKGLENNEQQEDNKTFDEIYNNNQQDHDNSIMSSDAMIETFIFNIKQITNHPTLLVDHYIPRNLLLLNSKENIINLSNKYHQISEILDKLVERDVTKTIIINVSNAKEMDLIESFLLGKCGIQYYRFSGSSLFYDNHGSFDFHKDLEMKNSTNNLNNIDVSLNPVTQSKKRKNGRGKKINNSTNVNNNVNSANNLDNDSNQNFINTTTTTTTTTTNTNNNNNNNTTTNSSSSTNSGSNNNNNNGNSSKKKKKTGRPSSAEKRAREQQAQVSTAISGVTSSDQNFESDQNSNHKLQRDREEYIPKISKNNNEFYEKLLEKKSKKLNVYLILSSQLKYLLQFEDLKSDLILSLDSGFIDFEDLSNILDHKVPILKPIIVESLEHYEWELDNNKENIIYDVNQPIKRQRKQHQNNLNNDKSEFNRLLALLSIAAWPNVGVQLTSNINPLSDDIIDWLIDPKNKSYPYSQTINTQLPHILDTSLINKVMKILNSSFELSNTLGVLKLNEYEFFNSNLNINKKEIENEIKIKHDNKRIKLDLKNDDDDQIPIKFNYSLYQFHLTKLINDTLQRMQSWIMKTDEQLSFVHLDETERQYMIDKGNLECGELFKKDRDLGVQLEARNKIKGKLNDEVNKFEFELKDLKERYEIYLKLDKDDKKFEKQDDEIFNLKEKLKNLKMNIDQVGEDSNKIRSIYQEKSSQAAELSAVVKNLENDGKKLQEESEGVFKQIHIKSILEKQEFVDKRIKELSNNCSMWNGYLEILNNEVEKRGNTVSTGSRAVRSSRNNTPY
jgi:hypothetical protein